MITKTANDITALREETADLGQLALSMTVRAVRSFAEADPDLAQETADDYRRAAEESQQLEELALRVMLLYQPAAADARLVYAALESGPHLERIARNAQKVAESVTRLDGALLGDPSVGIERMGGTAEEMVRIAVTALQEQSTAGFDRLRDLDDILDNGRREAERYAEAHLHEHPEAAEVCIGYLEVTRSLERIGDHACGLAEKVAFLVTGVRRGIDV